MAEELQEQTRHYSSIITTE